MRLLSVRLTRATASVHRCPDQEAEYKRNQLHDKECSSSIATTMRPTWDGDSASQIKEVRGFLRFPAQLS
ncbi:hypothetical protein [Bradyrhizobium sp. STM 3566]|uniref:hypothetical protein n=1 Tax=Bradyrhizobium sp. STM 3566 TaxID=578928 RepID=UPI00388FD600